LTTAPDHPAVALLADIRAIFAAAGDPPTITSAELCARLAAVTNRPWSTFSGGGPITPRKVAVLLHDLGLAPARSKRQRFWRRADLEPAWQRHLTSGDPSSKPSPPPDRRAVLLEKARCAVADLTEAIAVRGRRCAELRAIANELEPFEPQLAATLRGWANRPDDALGYAEARRALDYATR
jgi:hypothetical protein